MNIIITGVSRGIGKELVKIFCSKSDNLVFGLSRNIEKMEELKSSDSLSNYIPIKVNITKQNELEETIERIKLQVNNIDILINNAGFLINKKFEDISFEEMNQIYSTNIISPALLIKLCIPLLQKSINSHVVNISSMGGFQGSAKFSGLSIYASSKAAIASLTECLAEEYKEINISFNCLALGAVQTEMLSEAFPGYKAPTTPEEMSEFIYNFAIRGNKYFNGKILPVSISTP